MKSLVAFDLDGTLAESKQPIGEDMAVLLAKLLDVCAVTVISGGDWPQLDKQVVSRFPAGANFARLFIMPTTGTKMFSHRDGGWSPVYVDGFAEEQRKTIFGAIEAAIAEELPPEKQLWGERIEDRGSQVTFSGLGQEAPPNAKKAWDPDFAKRMRLQKNLRARLPELAINIGGSTSIDITHQGIDKAYGMRRLTEQTNIPPEAILFLGDALYAGGNDYPVRAAGIDSVAVGSVGETMNLVMAIIACLRP
jgi:phosphomannomutase